jgi:hypothetical protein
MALTFCWVGVAQPSLLAFLLSQVKMFLGADPSVSVLTVSNMDSIGACQSPSELAVVAAEGSKGGPQLRAVNYIAQGIEQEFPHVVIDMLAYSYSTDATKTRPRPNVVVQVALNTDGAVPLTDPMNVNFTKQVASWNNVSDRMWLWGYQANFWSATPRQAEPLLYCIHGIGHTLHGPVLTAN